MIPKIIHYCWFGGKTPPKSVKKCIRSWKRACPNYKIIEWNEKNFNVESSAFAHAAYKAKAWAFVSDYARLKIIYENGGIYLDTDVELLRSLDELLKNDAFFATEQHDKLVATGLGFGAIEKHETLAEMLKLYDSTEFKKTGLKKIACPILNTAALKKYGFKYSEKQICKLNGVNCKVYPPKYFDPLAPGNTQDLQCSDTFSIHHYNASWTRRSNVVKRKIFNIIGAKRMAKLKRFCKKGLSL